MKGLVISAILALVCVTFASAVDECHYCVQYPGYKGDNSCDKDYKTVKCKDQKYPEGTDLKDAKFACAKFTIIDAKDKEKKKKSHTLRNCYIVTKDKKQPQDKPFRTECHLGFDHAWTDDKGKTTKFVAGNLCLCEKDKCNSGSMIGLQTALLGLAIFLKFLF